MAVQQHRHAGCGSLSGGVRCAAAGGFGTLTVVGLLLVLGVAAVPLLAVLAGSHPRLLARHTSGNRPGKRHDQPDRRAAGQPAAGEHLAAGGAPQQLQQLQRPLSQLSTAELCQRWQASYPAMPGRLHPAQHAVLAGRRQGLLDELERRDPAGVAAWLAAGARAGSDPRRHLTPDSSHSKRP